MNHYVFVYGTLRRQEPNHYLLKNAALLAEHAWTNGRLYDTGLGYPAVKESATDKVYGEIYTVTDAELDRLDELEGYEPFGENNLYIRKRQIVFHDTGSMEAFIYIIAEQNESLLKKYIPSGDWKQYGIAAKKDVY